MNDAALTPPPLAAAPRRSSVWRWTLLLVLLCGLLALGASALLLKSLAELSGNGVHISINDETVHIGAMHTGTALLVLGAVLAAVLMLLCAVPVILALALTAAALGIGITLLAVLTVAAIELSPMWLVLLLVWWALRPTKPRPPAAA